MYLNGKEVARRDLPEGKLSPATPGNAYPDEAWVDAQGKPLPTLHKMKPEHKDRAVKRDRAFGPVALPVDQVRKGLNVLAIEVHRSDYHPVARSWWSDRDFMYGAFRGWVPLGLDDLELVAVGSGVTANVGRPAGIEVWTPNLSDRLETFNYPDPRDAGPSVVIHALRNGQFSAAVAASSDQPLQGFQVTAGDLVRSGGGTIPASAIRVRYILKAHLPETVARYEASKVFDAMLESPLREPASEKPAAGKAAPDKSPGAAMLAWLTIRVPKDAAAGEYEGKVQVAVEGRSPVEIPLQAPHGRLDAARSAGLPDRREHLPVTLDAGGALQGARVVGAALEAHGKELRTAGALRLRYGERAGGGSDAVRQRRRHGLLDQKAERFLRLRLHRLRSLP